MLLKYIPMLLLAQLVLAAPTSRDPSGNGSHDPIAYFTEVKAKLSPQSKRAGDIDRYVSRVNEAIAENDLDKKDQIWLDIFEEN
ncbi:GL21077 [Drosophila persimilis]|uniref:GL21077 n=1 Tax=Drosophila persimilis TaxID=7234 RepID=B4GX19_DROPE|nr:GL21077 [Drosophila persimilis]